jgi:probable HAF family extracellular repeat protein
MNLMHPKLTAAAAAVAAGAMLASATSAHAATEYQLTIAKSPVLPNAIQTAPLNAIYDLGTPVGSAHFPGLEDTQPTLGSDFERLSVPGDPTGKKHSGEAFGINDAGTVVGYAQQSNLNTETGFGLERPFAWDDGAVGRELDILPGKSVQPQGINDAGDIVGLSFAGNGLDGANAGPIKTKGFELSHDGTLTTLPPLAGGKTSKAAAVNASGVAVGQADQGDTTKQFATSSRDGVPTDLGALGSGTFSAAVGVNAGGVAVGFSQNGQGQARAVMFANGGVTDLNFPTFGAGRDVKANAINDLGTIVGTGDVIASFVVPHAVRYQAGQAVDLNTLIAPGSGYTLTRAFDVDNAGQIVGTASPDAHPDQTLSYILTPIH